MAKKIRTVADKMEKKFTSALKKSTQEKNTLPVIVRNGVQVKIDVDPYYDDPVRNKILHPEGGVAYSYRYDIFYIGTQDQPNIQKCQIKGQPEYRGYEWGLRNPFTGQMGNPYMSHDEDSATFHRMATLGIVVLDPTRTMSIIPAVLQG